MATERRDSWVKNYEAVDFEVALERDAMLPHSSSSANALASTSEVDLTTGQQQPQGGTHASYHPLSSINPPLPINGPQHMPPHSQTDTHPSSSSSLSPGPSQPNSQATTPGSRPIGSNPNLRNSTASKYHQRSSPLAASYPSSPTTSSSQPNLINNSNTMEKPTSGATATGSNSNLGSNPETQSHPLLFPGQASSSTTTTSPPPPVHPQQHQLHQQSPSPPSGHARPTMSSFGASTSSGSPPPGGTSLHSGLGRPGSRGSMILYRVADPFSTPAHSAPGTLSRSSTSGLAALAAEQQHLTSGGSGGLSPIDPSSSASAAAGYTPPHPAFFQNSHGSRSNRASTYSMSGDSIVSFASDSKYPAHNVMAGYGGYGAKSPLSPPGGSRAPSLRMSGLNALGGATPSGSVPGTPGGLGAGSTMSGVGPGTLNYKGSNQLNIGVIERGLVAYVYDPDEDEDDSDEGSDWEGSLHGDDEEEEAKRNSKMGGAGGGSLNSRKALTAASVPSGKGKPPHHPSHPPYKPKSTFLSGRAWLNLSTLLILLLSILALFILYPVITFGDASGRRMELITGNTRINGSGQAVGDGGDVPARGAQVPVGVTSGTGTATGTTSTTAVVNTQTQTTTSTSTTPVLVNTDTATTTSTDTSLVTPTDTTGTDTTGGTTGTDTTGGTTGTDTAGGPTTPGTTTPQFDPITGLPIPPTRRGVDNGGGSPADPIRRLRRGEDTGGGAGMDPIRPLMRREAEDAGWDAEWDKGKGEEKESDSKGSNIQRWTKIVNGHLVEYAFPQLAQDDPLIPGSPSTQDGPHERQPLRGIEIEPVLVQDPERIRACIERIKGKQRTWMVDGERKTEMAKEIPEEQKWETEERVREWMREKARVDAERAAAAEIDAGVPADADGHADYEVEDGWVWVGDADADAEAEDDVLAKRGDEEDWRANVEVDKFGRDDKDDATSKLSWIEVDKFGRAIKDEESWRANVEVDKFGRSSSSSTTDSEAQSETLDTRQRNETLTDPPGGGPMYDGPFKVKRGENGGGGASHDGPFRRDDPDEGGQRRDDPDEGGQRRGYEGDAAERLAWIEVDKFGRDAQAGYEGDVREGRMNGDDAERLAWIEVDKFGRGEKDEESWRANVEVDKFGRSGGDVERSGGDVERRTPYSAFNSRVMRNVQAQPEQNANRW